MHAETSHIKATNKTTQHIHSVTLNNFFKGSLNYQGDQDQLSKIITAGQAKAFQSIITQHSSWQIFLLKIDT